MLSTNTAAGAAALDAVLCRIGIVAPVNVQFAPVAVRITTFSFTDVCGNTHEYDAAGAPACNDIRASGTGFGSYTLACNTRLDANCPEACN